MGKASITVPQESEDTGGYTLDVTYPESVYAVPMDDSELVSVGWCAASLISGEGSTPTMWISPAASKFSYGISNLIRPDGGQAPSRVVVIKASVGNVRAWGVVYANSNLFYPGWQSVAGNDKVRGYFKETNEENSDEATFKNLIGNGVDYVNVTFQLGILNNELNYNPLVNDTAVYSKSFTVKLMAPQSWAPSFDLAFLLSQTYGGKCYTNVSSVRYGVSNVAFPGGASLGAGSSVALNGVSTQVGSLPFENVIALVPRSGVNEVTATIVDSRGRSTTKTATFVAEYPPSPTIGEMAVSRCLADGTRDDDGGFVRIDFEVSGSDSPPVELDYIYVEVLDASGSAFGFDDIQGLAPSLSLSSHRVIAGVGNGETATNLALSPNEQYSVTLTVKGLVNDELRNGTAVRRCLSSKTVILPRAFRLMDCLAGGRGIAFGAPATEEGFLCAMESTFDPPIPNDSLDAAPRSHTHDYAASGHRHAAGDITSGTLPVVRGGTGRAALVGSTSLLRDLFDTSLTGAGYIPVFTESWADGGYMSKSQLRSAMGISNHVTAEGNSGIWHYRKYSNGYAEAWGVGLFALAGMADDNWRWLSSTSSREYALPFTFKTVVNAQGMFNSSSFWPLVETRNASNSGTRTNVTKLVVWGVSAAATTGTHELFLYVSGTY